MNIKNIRTINLLGLLLSISLQSFCQTNIIKEIRNYHSNDNEQFVVYKNQNLEVIKEELFDYNGKMLSSYNIDPVTKKKHGDFIDVPNSGTYNQGKLTCESCSLVVKRRSYGYNDFVVLKGDFLDGKPMASIEVYEISIRTKEPQNNWPANGENPVLRNLLSLPMPQQIQYLNLYKLKSQPYSNNASYVDAWYNQEYKLTLKYNKEGELDGKIRINNYSDLFFEKGVLQGFTTKDRNVKNVLNDSVFSKDEIWKVDNVFMKNTGWLVYFYWGLNDLSSFKFSPYDPIAEAKGASRVRDKDRNGILNFRGANVFFGPNAPVTSEKTGFELKRSILNAVPGVYQKAEFTAKKVNNRLTDYAWWDPEDDIKIKKYNADYRTIVDIRKSVNYVFKNYGLIDRLSNKTELPKTIDAGLIYQDAQNSTSGGLFFALLEENNICSNCANRLFYLDDILEIIFDKILGSPDSPISKIYIPINGVYTDITEVSEFKEIVKRAKEISETISLLEIKTKELDTILKGLYNGSSLVFHLADSKTEKEAQVIFDTAKKELLDLRALTNTLPEKSRKNQKVIDFLSAVEKENKKLITIKYDRSKFANAQKLIKEGGILVSEILLSDAEIKYKEASTLLKQLDQYDPSVKIVSKELSSKEIELNILITNLIIKDAEDYNSFITTLEQQNVFLSLNEMPLPKEILNSGVFIKDYRPAFDQFLGEGTTRFFLNNQPKEGLGKSLELRNKTINNIVKLNNYIKQFDKYLYPDKSFLYPSGIIFQLTFKSKIKKSLLEKTVFSFNKDEFKVFNKYWKKNPVDIFAFYNFNDDQFYFFPYGFKTLLDKSPTDAVDVLLNFSSKEKVDEFKTKGDYLFRAFNF
jgi:hypothetical protein